MLKKRLLYFLFYWANLILVVESSGQELETLPASTKWSQIKTENFEIIFQNGFESEANRTANILETIHSPASQSLGVKPRSFSVILQNQNAISNGFVTIGPRRSEFFTTYSQDNKKLGNVDWLEHLAVHEYRHMVQFEKAYKPTINKLMYLAFGEYGVGFSAGIAAPSWFWEGDAVGMETSITRTGRGRTPDFALQFKANLLEKGGFNYNKQHLTSFKDFVPNHYRTGYFMTTYFKRKYGADIWDKIIDQSFQFPFIPFVFSNAIKKETGLNLNQNYKGMLSEMKALYSTQTKFIPENIGTTLNKRKTKVYTDYHYPKMVDSGNILALKSGFSDTQKIVSIDNKGKEKTLFTTGIMNDPGFLSINNNMIVWTEYEFDPRWLKRTYSVIKSFSLNDNSYRRITKKSKYSSAALSHDGATIVAINNSEHNKHSIQLLDFFSGEAKEVFDNPNNAFYSMPSFSPDDQYIVVLKMSNDKKFIVKKNINTSEEQVLLETVSENFGHPVLFGPFLFYNSPINGIDNIYALNLLSKEIFQVTNSKLGSFNPSISKDGKEIVYNNFTVNGMDIISSKLDPNDWLPIENVENRNINFEEPMIKNEGLSNLLDNVGIDTFEIKPYKKIKHTIKPHSWGISAIPTNTSLIFGINSQDILSTTTISAGLKFDSDERNWLKFGNISYQGLYPIIDVSIVDGTRSALVNIESGREVFNWNETSLSAGLRIPLILTNSKYLRKLSLSSKSILTSVSGFKLPQGLFIDQSGNGNLRALEHSIGFVNNLRRSKLDLNSKYGQSLLLNLKHTPIGGVYHSTLLSAESNLYFPGFIKHHSFQLRGSFQSEDSQNYYFNSPIRFTRGISYAPFRYFTNWSINYKMPIWCPDIHIGPLLNVQRVYINGFYDKGWGRISSNDRPDISFKSYGAEISFNFNLMRYLVLFDVGLRYSYVPEFKENRTELIIGAITF
jgi:hypothetical protein